MRKVRITPMFVEYVPDVLLEGILYISEYGTAIHLCLCGCKNKTVTPLTDDMWSLSVNINGAVSLSPSIGNYSFPCRSHYIITNNIAEFQLT